MFEINTLEFVKVKKIQLKPKKKVVFKIPIIWVNLKKLLLYMTLGVCVSIFEKLWSYLKSATTNLSNCKV